MTISGTKRLIIMSKQLGNHTTDILHNSYIVLELCAGTLGDVCDNKYRGPELPSDETVLYQIACGLDFIHSKKLVHRDIKPENILISLTDPVMVKISDFGLSKPTNSRGTFTISGIRGTLNWIAPECFTSQNLTGKRGSVKSDIFSTGCVFFYFVTRGTHPFGENLFIMTNIRLDNPVNLSSNLILKKKKNFFTERKCNCFLIKYKSYRFPERSFCVPFHWRYD